jgi:AbrB family looped-hinge helix DNA binding protein
MVMVFCYGMKEMTIPIDQAGRIVLPKDVRQELAIKPGDMLKLSIHGSSVTLTPNREAAGFVRKGHALVFSTSDAGPLNQETVNEILEGSRNERHNHNLAGLRGPRHKA